MSKYKNVCNYYGIFKYIKYFYVLTRFNRICTNMLSLFLILFTAKARRLCKVSIIVFIGIEAVMRRCIKD
jgi:hypothetical protein